MPPWDPELPKTVIGAMRATDGWRSRYVRACAIAAWAYERDRLFSRQEWGEGGRLPDEHFQRVFDWLDEVPPSINLVKSAVDTMTAWLFSQRIGVEVRAAGAKWDQKRQIEARTMALDSVMGAPKPSKVIRRVLRDGANKGIGLCRPIVRGGRVQLRRLHFYQVFFDPHDARDGEPTHVSYYEWADRREVMAWLEKLPDVPRRKERLAKLAKLTPLTSPGHELSESGYTDAPYDWEIAASGVADATDRVCVVYSYRVATADGAADGRVVITAHGGGLVDNLERGTMGGLVLWDGAFPRATLPIVRFTPYPPDEGIIGQGLEQLMRPWQAAIDRSFAKLQTALDKYGHLRIIVPPGSIKNLDDFAAMGITVIEAETESEVPRVFDPVTLRPEDIQWIDRVLTWSRDLYGLSQMLSQGGSDLGAGASAVALVEESFRGKDRFADVIQEVDEFELAVAREVLNAIDDAVKMDPAFKARFEDGYGRSLELSWAELTLPSGEYDLRLEPVGMLGRERSGRAAKAVELADRQVLDPTIAKEMLLSSPDIRRAAELETASIRLVEMQLDELLDPKGQHLAALPDDDTDLDVALPRVNQYISLSKLRGASAEAIERLREYKRIVEAKLNKRQADMQPSMQPMGPGPGTAGPDIASLMGAAQAGGLMGAPGQA